MFRIFNKFFQLKSQLVVIKIKIYKGKYAVLRLCKNK